MKQHHYIRGEGQFRVSRNQIYENTGNRTKDRLVVEVLKNGARRTGPGLAWETMELFEAVPERQMDEAIGFWRNRDPDNEPKVIMPGDKFETSFSVAGTHPDCVTELPDLKSQLNLDADAQPVVPDSEMVDIDDPERYVNRFDK